MKLSLPLKLAPTALLLLAAGCAEDWRPRSLAGGGAEAAAHAATTADLRAGSLASRGPARAQSFASLPDRGDLVGYPEQRVVRRDGAYTWHRADLSEAHALAAIGDGSLRLTTPAGEALDFRYERHVEHPSGDWTWIGRLEGGHRSDEVVLTFGEKAAFGTIAQPGKAPLKLTMSDGTAWLVEVDPTQIAQVDNAATRPVTADYLIPPKSLAGAGVSTAASGPEAAASTHGVYVDSPIDLVLGYTSGFAQGLGGRAQAVTRLNNMVEIANQAFSNSGITARVNLVHTLQVEYPDATANKEALEQLTGYSGGRLVAPNAAFSALRNAREQYGADLVSLVRRFNDPENAGCGIAWLIGGGRSGIDANDEYFGYSVVSDGRDAGTDGKTYFCREETLAHEIGHNLGSQHDSVTAGTDSSGQPKYGAYTYSFGHKTTDATNFYTVMAYGDSGQKSYRVFSNPRITFCGTWCGAEEQSDNARSINQTAPIISRFRGPAMLFSDVANNYWVYGQTHRLYQAGVTTGCSTWPRSFCPGAPVSRDQMAIFLLRAKYGSSYAPPAPTGLFTDVPTSHWAAAWIEQLYRESITTGCGASPLRYCPDTVTSRAEMAVFLLRAKHGSNYIPPTQSGVFDDVPTSNWSAPWVEQLAASGVTSGCSLSPKLYCPNDGVTREQMAVFLVRNFGL